MIIFQDYLIFVNRKNRFQENVIFINTDYNVAEVAVYAKDVVKKNLDYVWLWIDRFFDESIGVKYLIRMFKF